MAAFVAQWATAQQEPVREIRQVEVADTLRKTGTGYEHFTPDAVRESYMNTDLSRLLERSGPAYVRDYGPGGISSITVRGAGSSQTRVHLDGVELNNPSLGMFDLKLLPAWLLGDIQLQPGNSAQQVPFGGLGGNVNLQTADRPEQQGFGAQAMTGIGSFGRSSAGAGAQYRKNGFFTQTRLFWRDDDNDFNFRNIAENPAHERDLYHSGFQQRGLFHHTGYLGKNYSLAVRAVHTDTRRELPPIMTNFGREVNQTQEDQITTVQLPFAVFLGGQKFSGQPAYVRQVIHYQDPDAGINSLAESHSFQNYLRSTFSLSEPLTLKLQYAQNHTVVENNQLTGDPRQTTFNFLHHLTYERKQWSVDVTWKPTVVNEGAAGTDTAVQSLNFIDFMPFTVGAEWQPFAEKTFSVFLNGGRNIRTPTLNDRYWGGAGNPDLQPEVSYNAEAGLKVSVLNKKDKSIILQTAVFAANVEDWIQWVPQESGLWQPVNYQNVEQLGMETTLKAGWTPGNWNLTAQADYTYTRAVEQSSENQLIYTPRHMMKTHLNAEYKTWRAAAFYQHTGIRYITTDNETYLPDFATLDLTLSKQFTLNRHRLNAMISVNNLLDENYMNVVWRPMPGRWFEMTVRYDLR